MHKKELSNSDFAMLFDEANEVNDSSILKLVSHRKERYVNFEEYNEGGLKKIYICDDLKSGRRIIMAKLKENDHPRKVEKFLKEARVNAALQHPNIVPVYDIGIDRGEPWFTMKIIDGMTLQEKIELHRRGKYSHFENLNNRLDIFNKICDAISYAHSKGVIHCDLNPQNVSINDFGDVVVFDWGMADIIPMECDERLLELCTLTYEEQKTGVFEGTPGYASPEHAGVLKTKKSKSSDIFSLGTILYSLLTYEAPFRGKNVMEIIEKTILCDFKDPSLAKPELKIPESVEAICIKAMEPNPDERYHSVEDLQRDILAYRNGFTTEAENASLLKAAKLFFLRNKAKSLFSLSLFFALFILFIFYFKNIKLAKENAEQVAEKNRIEKEYYEKINKESAPLFLDAAKNAYDSYLLDDALNFSSTTVQVDPSLKEAWKIKGIVELAENKFQEAHKSFRMAGDEDYFAHLAQEYASKHGNSKLTINEYFVLYLDLRSNGKFYESSRLMSYKIYSELRIEDRIFFCKAVLKVLNSYNEEFDFNFDQSKSILNLSKNKWITNISCLQNFPAENINLSNTNITNFTGLKNTPLKKLNVSGTRIVELNTNSIQNLIELDISNTAITNLHSLNVLSLEVLNISYTPIFSFHKIITYKKLKKLYIDKEQASKNYLLEQIPKKVELIIVE